MSLSRSMSKFSNSMSVINLPARGESNVGPDTNGNEDSEEEEEMKKMKLNRTKAAISKRINKSSMIVSNFNLSEKSEFIKRKVEEKIEAREEY